MSSAPNRGGGFSNKAVFIMLGGAAVLMLICGGAFMVMLYSLAAPGSAGSTSTGRKAVAVVKGSSDTISADGQIAGFFEDLRSNRIGDAYERTSHFFQTSLMSRGAFEDFIAKNKAFIGHMTRSSSETTERGVKTIKGSVTGGPYGSCDYTVSVSLEPEGWRISKFTVP